LSIDPLLVLDMILSCLFHFYQSKIATPKSFNEYMHEQSMKDTLFANQDWSEWRDPRKLEKIVIEYGIVSMIRGSVETI